MRGSDAMQESLFMVAKLEDFVPGDDSLRGILELVNDALRRLDGLFDAIYAASGRDSIAPEKLVRALLLQIFYSVRSERQLMEQIRYNLLFCLTMEERVWDHSVFSKNRDRLLEHESNRVVFFEVLALAEQQKLLSKDHVSVDGALIQEWPARRVFVRRTDRTRINRLNVRKFPFLEVTPIDRQAASNADYTNPFSPFRIFIFLAHQLMLRADGQARDISPALGGDRTPPVFAPRR